MSNNSAAYSLNASDYVNTDALPSRQTANAWQQFWSAGSDQNRYDAEYESQINAYNTKQSLLDKQYEIDAVNSARAWEEYYDSTKYQRAVKDLTAAGLNPWLAAQGSISGSGNTSAATGGSSHSNSAKASNSSSKGETGINGLVSSAMKVLALVALKGLFK